MRWAEPASNPIRSLPTYTYFFLVTVATVGYGDVVPVTTIGRMAAGTIAIGGIGAAAVALGNVFNAIGNLIKRRERGFAAFDMKDHIVIFGNRGAETAVLIRQLIADQQSSGSEIVLCSERTERNPFPDFIDFVRGEPTSKEVLERAAVKDASKIIIHAGTDYESICIALAVKEINHKAAIVVRANDPGKEVDIERIDRDRIVCIKAVDVPMMVREVHNPGITQVLEKSAVNRRSGFALRPGTVGRGHLYLRLVGSRLPRAPFRDSHRHAAQGEVRELGVDSEPGLQCSCGRRHVPGLHLEETRKDRLDGDAESGRGPERINAEIHTFCRCSYRKSI